MSVDAPPPGHLMARESAECVSVFCDAAGQTTPAVYDDINAFYTIARGSSDAAANVLSYEFMRWTGAPMTSLPPSVFSLGNGVNLAGSAVVVISQSGASDDLVQSANGAHNQGAKVIALVNQPNSPVEAASDLTMPIRAGAELAVPATKSVVGSIGAGMALLSGWSEEYAVETRASCQSIAALEGAAYPQGKAVVSALLRARHVYVIGRDTGYGAAHEIALKLKECCALHAEAYSASEVLHGPLQLATNPLCVLILDTGVAHIQDSLDQAEARFRKIGCDVHRLRLSDMNVGPMTSAAAAAAMLILLYPVILHTALALGLDPDAPATLSKVTQTT